MAYVISEAEKTKILGLHDRALDPGLIRERINSFRFTSDMKYVVFENNFYSCETGELYPLMEKWSLSDILHTVGDVASIGMDFIIPGSGAIVDAVNALSYFIEGLFQKDKGKRNKLFIMGAITAAFVILPGPLQAVAVPMKRFVKYGAKQAISSGVLTGLQLIMKNLGKITSALPRLLKRVMNTGLGQKVFKNSHQRIAKEMGRISGNIENAFNQVIKDASSAASPKAATKVSKAKQEADKIARVSKKIQKVDKGGIRYRLLKTGGRILIGKRGVRKLSAFFSKGSKNVLPVINAKLLRKLGFGKRGHYAYVTEAVSHGKFIPKVQTIKILDITDNGVQVLFKESGRLTNIPNATFIDRAVGAPWIRKGSQKYVPLFIKRMSDLLLPENGGLNEEAMAQLPDLNPSQTSMESLAYLRDELAEYEGNLGAYTVNTTVTSFQKALVALGYPLPRFGQDGKFGPETQQALKKFQVDRQLEDSDGKMDRLTAEQLALGLKDNNVPNSQELQNTLNSL